jgi:hypothetical protein
MTARLKGWDDEFLKPEVNADTAKADLNAENKHHGNVLNIDKKADLQMLQEIRSASGDGWSDLKPVAEQALRTSEESLKKPRWGLNDFDHFLTDLASLIFNFTSCLVTWHFQFFFLYCFMQCKIIRQNINRQEILAFWWYLS